MNLNTILISGIVATSPIWKEGKFPYCEFLLKHERMVEFDGTQKLQTLEMICKMYGETGKELSFSLSQNENAIVQGRLKFESFKDRKQFVISVSQVMSLTGTVKRKETEDELPF